MFDPSKWHELFVTAHYQYIFDDNDPVSFTDEWTQCSLEQAHQCQHECNLQLQSKPSWQALPKPILPDQNAPAHPALLSDSSDPSKHEEQLHLPPDETLSPPLKKNPPSTLSNIR